MIITVDKLNEILTLHLAWLRNQPEGVRADLSRANLSGANLYGANLSGANLYGANLYGAKNCISFNGGRHIAVSTVEKLTIGCHTYSHTEWIKNYKSIGKKENYSQIEVEAYGAFIKLASVWAKKTKRQVKNDK